MGSTSCRTELVSLRPKISTTPFLSQRHWSCSEPQSSPPRNTQPVSFRRTIGDRRAANAWARHYFVPLGPSFRLPLFLARPPARPPSPNSLLLSYLACCLTFLPPAFSLSLSLAEKLLNFCCHARQRTVLKVAELLLSRSSENCA
jgi:hypothetical protein